jgi:hypothetical protein
LKDQEENMSDNGRGDDQDGAFEDGFFNSSTGTKKKKKFKP